MKCSIRIILWCGLAIAVIACIALELIPPEKSESRLAELPLNGFGFAGRDLPLNGAEKDIFQGASVLKRLYQVGNDRVVLLAVDSDLNRHAIHDPLHCFRGSGWSVTGKTGLSLTGGSAEIVRLVKDQETVEALYWITDGRSRYTSPALAWWQSVVRRLHLQKTRQAPVLILLQPAKGTTVDWADVLRGIPDLMDI